MPFVNTWSGAGYPADGSQPAVPLAEGRIRTWVTTPNYGALAKDAKPVNPYVDTRYKVAQFVQTYSRRRPVSGGAYTYDSPIKWQHKPGVINTELESFNPTRINVTALRSSQANEVIIKALVKMADAKVNVAVAYAEASKTSDLILDTARRIDRAYRAFRKGDLRGIAQNLNITPKRLHKSWLEYKYGWIPLLMDVKGAAEYFAQQHLVRPTTFTVSASEEVVKTLSWTLSQATYGSGVPFDSKYFLSVYLKTRVKIWCELTSPHLSTMQQLGLTNPALVAWEVVPFSFVFDWIIHVGDWLTAATAQQGVTIKRAMISRVEDDGHTFTQPPTTSVVGSTLYETGGQAYACSERRYDRSIPDLSPFSLYPPVTSSFDFPKLVTSLALIQGNYRGKERNVRL